MMVQAGNRLRLLAESHLIFQTDDDWVVWFQIITSGESSYTSVYFNKLLNQRFKMTDDGMAILSSSIGRCGFFSGWAK